LSAAAVSALLAVPAQGAVIVVINQAQFNAAIAVATQPGHTDTIDATGATGVIDAGTTLTLPGAATTITLELNSFSIGAQVGDGTMTMDGGTAVTFGQGSSSSPELNIGDVFTGTLNINGGALTLFVLTSSPFINVGADGGTGTINMTSGSLTIDDSGATPGQFGALAIGYPFNNTSTPTTGTFNQSGGTVSLSQGALDIGLTGTSAGTFPVSGTYNLSGNAVLQGTGATLYVGQGSGGVGAINISGNSTIDFESVLTNGQMYVGSESGSGTITQNGAGSTVILNITNFAQFGTNVGGTANPAGTGTYNLMAGTLDIGVTPGSAAGGAYFGMSAAGTGILDQSGGTLVATAPVVIGNAGTGTYNLSGGTASFSDGLTIGEVAGSVGAVNQTAGTLTVSAGGLTIGSEGIAAYNLNGGILQVGGANGISGQGFLNPGGGTLQVIGSDLTSNIEIGLTGTSSVIDTNGFDATLTGGIFGNGGFTKVGSGTLALFGPNGYSGGTTITDGILQVGVDTGGAPGGASSPIGTGTLTFDGGTLQAGLNNFALFNAGVIDAPGGTIDANRYTFTYAGNLTGSGATDSLSIVSSVPGGVVVLSGVNTYAGGTFVESGTLEAGSTTAFSPNSTFEVSSGATLALGGNSVSIASLLDGTGGGGTVENGSDVDATLTLPTASGTTAFSGVLADGGSGTLSLAKTGDSVLILSGASTYTGTTSVTGGVLDVEGSLGETAVTIGNGAALAGTGSIAGGVTIASGGALLPGDANPGTITLGALTLSAGSLLDYRLGGPNVLGGASNALTNVTGALTIDGGTLDVNNSGSFGLGVYQLFTYGTLAGAGQITIGALPDGDTGVIQTAVPGQVDLVVNGPGTLVQFWDGATLTGDGTIHGGSGTWNASASNWTTPNGALNAAWVSGFAVFEGAAGTVTVAGPLSYQGLQFLTSGYVLSGNGTLAPQGVVPIRVAAGAAATIATAIIGTGGVELTDPGTLILSGANTYSGGTLVDAGTLGVGSNTALGTGAVSLVGSTLQAEANGLSIANDFTLSTGGGTIDTQADALTLSGVIGGTTELTKIGSGTLILTATNTWSGGTLIASGTLQLGAGGSLAAS
jgi:fibronectin-binding autotransporter adhesin